MAAPATINPEEQDLQSQGLTRSESQLRVVWRRFRRNKSALFGLSILIILVLVAVCAPWIAKEPWTHVDVVSKYKPISAEHWFGTDQYGRDVFSRIVWASRVSMSVGFVAAGVAVVIGATWGAIAGYYGGTWLDVTMMRIAEAVDSIPTLILLVVIASVFSRGIYTVMLVIGLTSWASLAFLVRAQFLSLRERDFVQAALALGADDRRIIFRHLLPNVAAIIIVNATLRIGNAILAESALSFIGYGPPPPYPTWGEMLATGRQALWYAPWVAIVPGLFITATVLAFNFVGDGLRDALDPKMKH
jgi:peptide/nickel transport system permease protein